MERFRKTSLRERYIHCRKDECDKCPHGPYLYRSWREGKKVRTQYLGKALKPNVEHPFQIGDEVIFNEAKQPIWVLHGSAGQEIRKDRVPMEVFGTGWSRLGPYVQIHLTSRVVYHPYVEDFAWADPHRRLDNRFPTVLIRKVK